METMKTYENNSGVKESQNSQRPERKLEDCEDIDPNQETPRARELGCQQCASHWSTSFQAFR